MTFHDHDMKISRLCELSFYHIIISQCNKHGCKDDRLSVSLPLTFSSICPYTHMDCCRGRWCNLLLRSFHMSPEAEGDVWKPSAIDLIVARNQQYIFVLWYDQQKFGPMCFVSPLLPQLLNSNVWVVLQLPPPPTPPPPPPSSSSSSSGFIVQKRRTLTTSNISQTPD